MVPTQVSCILSSEFLAGFFFTADYLLEMRIQFSSFSHPVSFYVFNSVLVS